MKKEGRGSAPKLLAEQEDGDDLLGWVQKSKQLEERRRKEEEKARAAATARRLAEAEVRPASMLPARISQCMTGGFLLFSSSGFEVSVRSDSDPSKSVSFCCCCSSSNSTFKFDHSFSVTAHSWR